MIEGGTDFLTQFEKEAYSPEPVAERLALCIAGLAYPELTMTAYLRELDRLAEQAGARIARVENGRPRAEAFLTAVTDLLGFRGNTEDYYAPANSYLNVVIDTRMGLPIMLGLVCMALGDRLQMKVEGIGFPGHFMVRYRDPAGEWLLDPFHNVVVDMQQASGHLSRIMGQPINIPAYAVRPVTPVALALRILNNLRNAYLRVDAYELAARVISYLLVLMPTNASFWQERGMLYHQTQYWEEAAHDFQRYFFLRGQLADVRKAMQSNTALTQLNHSDRHVLRIYRQVERTRRRLN